MSYIGTRPTVGNFVKLDSIVTSATTTFNLLNGGVAYSPQSANHCIVSLNGVIQSPNTSFTISGSTIVFASTLSASDVIDFILVLGDVLNIGTPSDATVGFSKVTSNLITGATAETSIDGADSILIYDDSATALRKMTRTNFVAGITGKILQVVHTRVTTSVSTSSTSQVASGILATITPTSASSTILIIGNLAAVRLSNGSWGELSLRRKIGAGSYTNFGNFEGGFAYDGHGVHNFGYGFSYSDSPATTSQLTYEIFYAKAGAGTSIQINADTALGSQFNFLEIGA